MWRTRLDWSYDMCIWLLLLLFEPVVLSVPSRNRWNNQYFQGSNIYYLYEDDHHRQAHYHDCKSHNKHHPSSCNGSSMVGR